MIDGSEEHKRQLAFKLNNSNNNNNNNSSNPIFTQGKPFQVLLSTVDNCYSCWLKN